MVRDINVGDIVKFKTQEMGRASLGEVTQVYQIKDALDPGLIGESMYIVEYDPRYLLEHIWDDLIIDVYKKVV